MPKKDRIGYASVLVSVFTVSCAVSLLGAYALSAKQAPTVTATTTVETVAIEAPTAEQFAALSVTAFESTPTSTAASDQTSPLPRRYIPTDTNAATSTTPPPVSTTTPSNATTSTSAGVFVVGDSLTVGARSSTEKLAHELGLDLTIDAVSGRSTRTGLQVLSRVAPPTGSVVVMALGTNDADSYEKYTEYIDKTMSTVPTARKVVWLTVWRKGPLKEINRAIYNAVLRYPNFVVVDWSATLLAHPEFLAADNTHHSSAGYKERSRQITAAIVS